jgi:hypothetical protein
VLGVFVAGALMPARATEIERPAAALDSRNYTIQAIVGDPLESNPLLDTYTRFANLGSASAVVSVKLVGDPSGVVYATVPYTLAAHGSMQIRNRDLVRNDSHISAYRAGDASIKLYLTSTGNRTSTSQVNFNSVTGLFENFNNCQYFSPGYDYSWLQGNINYIHTAAIAAYPSYIGVFNPNDFPVDVKVDVYNPAGKLLGALIANFDPHATNSGTTSADIQAAIGYMPGSTDYHISLVATLLTPGAVSPVYSHAIVHVAGSQPSVVVMGPSCAIEH